MKEENRGGKRVNAGRKAQYNEPTTTVAFRVPESKKHLIRQTINELLKSWKTTP